MTFNLASKFLVVSLVTRRLSTVVKANLILVINQGQLVESGRHEELERGNGMYARLARNGRTCPQTSSDQLNMRV